jgi:hypothetical protein
VFVYQSSFCNDSELSYDSVTNGLDRGAMQTRLRWWLTSVENGFPAWDSASKRVLLVARIHAGNVEKQW